MTLIVLHESSFPHETSKELWNLNRRVFATIPGPNGPVLQIDLYLIKLLHLLRDSWNLYRREPNREAVTIENARKTLRSHRWHVRIFDSDRCLIWAGASSKILCS